MSSPRTVLGPLTTTFTAPGYCANAVVACPYSCTYGWQAQQCVSDGYYTYQAEDATSCWPPVTSAAPTPTPPFNGWGFYSPGLICPSGYVAACTATAGGSSGWVVEYSMNPGETAVGCCPSGFVCGPQTCSSFVGSGGTVPVVTCSEGSSEGYSYLTVPATATATVIEVISSTRSSSTAIATTSSAEPFTITAFQVAAPMIELRWRSSDLSTQKAPKGTSSNSPTSSPAPGSSGLSTGAKAAIGVAVPVAVIAILVGIFLFWRRKTRKVDENKWPAPSSTAASFGQSGHERQPRMEQPMEMRSHYKTVDDRGRYMSPPREMDASPHPQELEGSKAGRRSDG